MGIFYKDRKQENNNEYVENNDNENEIQKTKKSIFSKCVICGRRNKLLNEYDICQDCELQKLRKAVLPEYNNLQFIENEIRLGERVDESIEK